MAPVSDQGKTVLRHALSAGMQFDHATAGAWACLHGPHTRALADQVIAVAKVRSGTKTVANVGQHPADCALGSPSGPHDRDWILTQMKLPKA